MINFCVRNVIVIIYARDDAFRYGNIFLGTYTWVAENKNTIA